MLHVYLFFGERFPPIVNIALTLALKPCGFSFAQLPLEHYLMLERCEIAIALLLERYFSDLKIDF